MQPIDVILKAKEHNLKVDFVKSGIASRIGDTIIMNINMPKYEEYCKKTLDHEIRHTDKIDKHNLMMDFFEGSLLENLIFCFRHPLAFTQFIPFGKYKGQWFIDFNQLVVYFIMVMVLGVWLKLTM